MFETSRFRWRRSAWIMGSSGVVALAVAAISPSAALAQPSPASVSFSSAGGGKVTPVCHGW
jgi:hypothetical protein